MKADGIALRSGLVRIVADRFERKHGLDVFLAFVAALCINIAPHCGCLKEGRLFVGEEEPPNGAFRFRAGKATSEFQGCSDPTAVVVRARKISGRIVVGAHDQDPLWVFDAWKFRFYIGEALARCGERLLMR